MLILALDPTIRPNRISPRPLAMSVPHSFASFPACLANFIMNNKTGRWQKALSLLEEIPSAGLTPNAHVYGSAVHACVVGGEPRRGLALLDEMIENGVVPDAAAFTVAMSAVDGWAAALRLLEVMKREVRSKRGG